MDHLHVHFGYMLYSVPYGNFYVKLTQSRLIFVHKEVKVSCLPLTSVVLLNGPSVVAQENYHQSYAV
jgi:hypothetical protein